MMSSMCAPPVPPGSGAETLVSKCEIPIIDLAHVGTERCPQKGVVKQVASKLVQALSEKGLALLVNHGIPDCKLKAVYRAMDEFCELPEESRSKYERVSPSNHGYVKPGVEKFNAEEREIRHSFNVTGKGGPLPSAEVPNFTHAVDELSKDLKQLTTMLLTALAMGLEQAPDFLLAKHAKLMEPGNESTMRLIYYPALGVVEPGVTRCGPHCDYGTFTLLAQDCEGGLEICSPPQSDRWGRVGHLPGAILVNGGDILASWTNNALPALKHRVVVPELHGRGRHSIAFFVHPDDEVAIEPLDVVERQLQMQQQQQQQQQQQASCRLQKKKNGVLTAYQHLQRRFRETYAS